MKLETYISANYESQAAFAREAGVSPAQVTQWIAKGFIVIDGELYSPRRELETPLPSLTKNQEPVFIAYSNNGMLGELGEFNLSNILAGKRHAYIYKATSHEFAKKWMRQYSHNSATSCRVAEIISEENAMKIQPDSSEHIIVNSKYF
ncbi:hypothetical protein FCH33_02025 [Serratia fonticola]|uniref:hypothetical protein n=1 Tax=Serratia fonticola TaxID=47917 RepID=UPI001574FD5D|nr:hypothetical protein [Serratia fonticola]NTY85554.1 hypothetical protein [Serratia fonticola]NTZ11603.1 hypothetical protein [Serratia fonticola]